MTREELAHLQGLVAVFLTNGNKSVDGMNDSRYFAFAGDEIDAYYATEALLDAGHLQHASATEAHKHAEGGAMYCDVIPTAEGIFEALR